MDDETEDSILTELSDLVDIEIGRRDKRPMCEQCGRPKLVCWCMGIDGCKINIESKVILFQHPHEEKRCLRTAPILEALISKEHFLELKGKRFTPHKFPVLKDIYNDDNTIVLYPGKDAIDINDLNPVGKHQQPYNIIILDGTWQQAKSIFYRNSSLHNVRQVCLTGQIKSQYVIRTQPTDEALSTVETAAIVLSTLEKDWSIYSQMLNPLKLICDFQMDHGAVFHDSKEQLILSGRYKKRVGKRTYKKLLKSGSIKSGELSHQKLLEINEMKKEINFNSQLTEEFENINLSSNYSNIILSDR